MTKNVRIGLLVLVVLCGGSVVFASQTVFEGSSPTCSFVNYLHVGGGEAFIEDEMAILLDVSYGFRLSPSLSLGAFIAVNPLSNFAHADLGLSIANTDAAYAMMSGMEMLFTFSPDSLVHPIMRLAVGGISVGYLEDVDGKEGYDVAFSHRSAFASVSAGLELNITTYMQLALRGGWRFAANEEVMGIAQYGLSGPEISLYARMVWETAINKQ
ncbi:hypothetical protein [uncultured Sphaerochaeta sp.]|uniref:hypothetical protein n=1 Tax=uncultured Sphaerochaeta sp. TaxID=886478 RepID=UPI002A0A4740|nr:hypothetical protein [uncultured Sphaerochaeta sp.]